jgi:hypothetical protein
MAGSLCLYVGILGSVVATVCLLRPRWFTAVRSRRAAAALGAVGVLISTAALVSPAAETRVTTPSTQLDRFCPVYEFDEVHSVSIAAPAGRIYQELKAVTADEVLFFRTLAWLRRLGNPQPGTLLDPPRGEPILQIATSSGFLLLADEPGRELVLGAVVWSTPHAPDPQTPWEFLALHGERLVIATINLHLETTGRDSIRLTTETRVHATDSATRRQFAAYWRMIYPGSAILRREWLRAVKHRSEQ